MAADDADGDDAPDPLIGTLIGERYRVLARVGRGGMGVVYRVEHVGMKKVLALKLLHAELSRLEDVARRFEREAEAAARLEHPNIVAVTDFGHSDGLLFLVMELLDGPTLGDVLSSQGAGEGGVALPAARALAIFRQILAALDHAHQAGVVHRDLKPDNIVLVERDGHADVVKLLDFGIAKITSGDRSQETLTQAGVVFGTPEYLSPEQAVGEEADGRADLYAAGVILFEMLTGRRPYHAASKVEIVGMHLTQPVPSLRRAAPQLAEAAQLDHVIARAMAKRREERYPTAAAFLAALDARPPTLRERAQAALQGGWSFLVGRAREAGLPWPRAFAGTALGLVALLLGAGAFALLRRPALGPEVARSLDHAEQLITNGDLQPARAALQQIAAAHPDAARAYYLLGNLDIAQNERERAIGDYRRALQLDGRLAGDALLRANVGGLLDRRVEGGAALALLSDDIGKPALPEILTCARSCKDERLRRRAAEAAVRLGGPRLLAEEGRPAPKDDDDEELAEKLRSAKSCKERKAAALALIASGERRHLDSLRAARDRRGGFLGIEEVNGCMRRELDAAIRKLEGGK